MGRRIPTALVAAATAALLLASAPTSASTSAEAGFVSRLNDERTSSGLGAVTVKTDLTQVAREWSRQMAAAGTISHDPNLPEKISGWTVLGDNVGKGPTVSSIHRAFMDSDTHRHIILEGRFNQVGVGVVQSGSTLYVTQIFARRASDRSSPAPAPRPRSRPRIGTVVKYTAAVPDTVMLTGRIWGVDLTAPPVTVDVLMQLLKLDAN